ncbi:hypothetical protein HAX54_005300, partial [Datura stramonium]|nr:hypothetical protein [Datura stramonium]
LRLLTSQTLHSFTIFRRPSNGGYTYFLRTIVTTPELNNPDVAAAHTRKNPHPPPNLPKRNPDDGSRVHFPNSDEVFIDGYVDATAAEYVLFRLRNLPSLLLLVPSSSLSWYVLVNPT